MNVPRQTGSSIISITATIVFGVIVVWTFVGLARYAVVAPPAFDGAMNLNTAASFAHGQGYGFFYDQFFSFPAQTDGPFILPAAFAFWLGGITPFTAQVTNLLYVAAFVVLVLALLCRIGVPLSLAVFAVMACMAMPGFVDYSMNGYGEVPAIVWFFGALIVLTSRGTDSSIGSRRLFFAGLLFGISYLTKVVALVCVAPAMFVLTCLMLGQPNWPRRLAALYFGFAAPVIAWELFRFLELGTVHAYAEWWRFQFGQIRAQSGAQRPDASGGLLHKGLHHLAILADLTGVAAPWLAICIVVPVVVGGAIALDQAQTRQTRSIMATLTVVVGLYFFWWLFISPTSMTWLRRIVDGLILLQCLSIAALAHVWPCQLRGGKRTGATTSLGTVAFIPVIVAQILLIRSGESVLRPPQPPGYALDAFRLAKKVRELPADATIYGTGWWQAPVVSLFSQRRFMNFDHWQTDRLNAIQNKYFVADMYTQGISQSSIKGVLDRSQYSTELNLTGGALYKLGSVQPYVPFTAQDAVLADLATGFDLSDGDYPHRRGMYERQGGGDAWVSPDAAVMLKRVDENVLRMTVDVPPDMVMGPASKSLVLRLASPGCLDRTVSLSGPGVQTLSLDLTCEGWPTEKPFLLTMHTDDQVPFVPQIDADNRLRSFKLRSIKLVHAGETVK
ncbi:hypothetical protein F3J20_04255 [Paraburkholderia sp. Cy-641]|uniref:hypothetical protein n=1 Tax=Paraburkholderia sp. Cy-641 TaxID=2608337 RepID=UPI00141FC81D|nr:hypothetical protein [Paraburkholderia sp. Cy-641]NIF76617.1 hypothetical protein [Paraburkholderia sp. Cy-641]